VSFLELCLYTNDKTKNYVARKYADSQRPSWKGEMHDDFDISRAAVASLPTPAGGPQTGPAATAPGEAAKVSRPPSEAEPGFVSLFDGRTLNGWTGDVRHYYAENGCLVADFGSSINRQANCYLVTQKAFRNYVLRLEYRFSFGANNGLLPRGPTRGDPVKDHFEIQILDDNAPAYATLNPRHRNGAVFDVLGPYDGRPKPSGQWNEMEVSLVHRDLTIALNGRVIIRTNLDDPSDKFSPASRRQDLRLTSGPIAFNGDYSTGRVEYRNIRIKELP